MFAIISVYFTIAVGSGIAYATIIGAAPAILYTSWLMKNNLFDDETFWILLGSIAVVWLIGYALIAFTGDFSGIFMLVYMGMMLVSLVTRFLFTAACMIACGVIGEMFFSHMWV